MEKEPQNERFESAFELRQATAEDCELMFRLQKLDGAELNHNDAKQVAQFGEYKNNFNPAEIQVIYRENKVIGRLRVVRGEEIYIGGMQILPEYRGGGIGTAILEGLIDESKRTSKSVRLEVFHSNQQAFDLYEGMDFKVIEENE
jgi:ribosomal protein S18 acetylase RimI-like enzyme